MRGSDHSVGIRSQCGLSDHNVGITSQCRGIRSQCVGIRSECGGIVSHFYRIKEQVSRFLVLLSGHDIGLDEVLIETICSTPKGHLVCYTRGIQEIQDYTMKYKVIQA